MTQPLSMLVATDLSALSRHAALRAAMLTRETGGTLTLLHVLETPALVVLRRLSGQAEADLEQRIATQAGDTLTALAQQIARQHAIDAPWHLAPGTWPDRCRHHRDGKATERRPVGRRCQQRGAAGSHQISGPAR